MVENFPNLKEWTDIQIQKDEGVSSKTTHTKMLYNWNIKIQSSNRKTTCFFFVSKTTRDPPLDC